MQSQRLIALLQATPSRVIAQRLCRRTTGAEGDGKGHAVLELPALRMRLCLCGKGIAFYYVV
eukprot:3484336-Prymnesium_polylepis.1